MNRYLFYLIVIAIDIYAFQAFRVWAQNWTPTGRTVLYTGYWLFSLLAVLLIVGLQMRWLDNLPRGLYVTLRALVFIGFISKLLVAGVLLIDDIRRALVWVYNTLGFGKSAVDLSRSKFLSRFALLLGGLPLGLLTYGMLRNRYRYQLKEVVVRVKNLPKALEGLRMVQISDIHSGSFTAVHPLKRAIDLINEQNPDLVFFTGDLVNNRAEEMVPYVDTFSQIQSKYGTYSILGNHDYGDYVAWPDENSKQKNMEDLYATHEQLGWDLLRNDNRMLEINGAPMAIVGVENWSALARFPKYGDLAKAKEGTEEASMKVLLSHDPTHWEAEVLKEHADIDLTLSGHTHGMQFGVEIPGWLKWSPASFVYKQWAGLYQQNHQSLYVNRGLGFLGYPGRVGILAEITLLKLHSEQTTIT